MDENVPMTKSLIARLHELEAKVRDLEEVQSQWKKRHLEHDRQFSRIFGEEPKMAEPETASRW